MNLADMRADSLCNMKIHNLSSVSDNLLDDIWIYEVVLFGT